MVRIYSETELLELIVTKTRKTLQEFEEIKLPREDRHEGQILLAIILGMLDKNKPHGYFIPLDAEKLFAELSSKAISNAEELKVYFTESINMNRTLDVSLGFKTWIVCEATLKTIRDVGKELAEGRIKLSEEGDFDELLCEDPNPFGFQTVDGDFTDLFGAVTAGKEISPNLDTRVPRIITINVTTGEGFNAQDSHPKLHVTSFCDAPCFLPTLQDLGRGSAKHLEGLVHPEKNDVLPVHKNSSTSYNNIVSGEHMYIVNVARTLDLTGGASYVKEGTPGLGVEPFGRQSKYLTEVSLHIDMNGPCIVVATLPKEVDILHIYGLKGLLDTIKVTSVVHHGRKIAYDTRTGNVLNYYTIVDCLDK